MTHEEIEREENREAVLDGAAFFCAVCHELTGGVDYCPDCHEGRCVVCSKAIAKGAVHEKDEHGYVMHLDCDP